MGGRAQGIEGNGKGSCVLSTGGCHVSGDKEAGGWEKEAQNPFWLVPMFVCFS